ncbi:MAG: Fe-S cluster assembly sulfur transfer protein SufU [Candidatus Entotheonellia bacterium]
MSDLRELYQELIIDHSKRPRNFRVLEEANRKSEGYNPLCGDKITVFLELENGRVKNVGFQGSGCAISTASASVMTESVKGKTLAEAEILFEVFHRLVTGKPPAAGKTPALGKLAAFSGVSEFPARVKCATLAWHTLHAALQGEGDTVSTE